jgi:hypothetical protein
MTGEQLKKIVAEFEAERNAKQAYKAALAKADAQGGKEHRGDHEMGEGGVREGRKAPPLRLVSFSSLVKPRVMPDADRLTPASSEDLADALAFALRYSGRTTLAR